MGQETNNGQAPRDAALAVEPPANNPPIVKTMDIWDRPRYCTRVSAASMAEGEPTGEQDSPQGSFGRGGAKAEAAQDRFGDSMGEWGVQDYDDGEQAPLEQTDAETSLGKLGLPPLRFAKTDRVLCLVDEDMWAAGAVASLNEDHPGDPTGKTKLPYVVKLDPPIGRLICVPMDDNDCCAPEVCFGQRAEALWWTLFCLPPAQATARRFRVGDRVAVAVEDQTDDFSDWAAGTVIEVDFSLEADAKRLFPHRNCSMAARIPYKVQLDKGSRVIVHRDEHWLVRDLALQRPGPRQEANGNRCLQRIETRQRSDGTWEAVDHNTRIVRTVAAQSAV